MIRIGIPNRGRAHKIVKKLLESRIVNIKWGNERQLITQYEDEDVGKIEIVQIRSTDIPRMLVSDEIQLGITGSDYCIESRHDLKELSDLHLLVGELCVLTSKSNSINSLEDLRGKEIVCYTQYYETSKKFFEQIKNVKCVSIDGAAEAYINMNSCDIIVDIVSSGETYIANNLKVIHKIMTVSSCLYATNEFVSSDKYNDAVVKKILGIEE